MANRIHQDFISIARQIDPSLAVAIESVGPVRLRRRGDQAIADVLFRTIAGQQLSSQAARSIWGRVVADAGQRPLIEHVTRSRPDRLRRCGLSAAKVKSMKAIADASRTPVLDRQILQSLDHAERCERLTAIWGVGQWTADMLGIFYFADPDVWPEGDLAVGKTLQKLTGRRRKATLTAARFAPKRSYLALYLWRITDAKPV